MGSRVWPGRLRYQESALRDGPRLLLVCAGAQHTPPLYRGPGRNMPRVELLMSVAAGISGGLAGLVWHRVVTAAWFARSSGSAPAADEPASRQVAAAALFVLAGAVLGLLFWLGWGLISLVNARWYGVALPMTATLALRLRDFSRAALVLAVEWLVTCAAIGLSCALAWHRYA
jgi:hypothetical protein